eukprot:1723368-Amphidinium_carterae.3
MLGRIKHPCVVQMLDAYEDLGSNITNDIGADGQRQLHIVMELLPETLHAVIGVLDGQARDPQVTAELNTICVWQRRLDAGRLDWPLEERAWSTALNRGRGRGPIRHLHLLADRLGWLPEPGGWRRAI